MHSALQRHVGRVEEGRRAKDPVSQPAIRQWCEAVDDWNPAYLDEDWARAHRFGEIIAPATSLNMWTLPGNRRDEVGANEPLAHLFGDLARFGFTSMAAVTGHQEYLRPLRLGDRLSLRQSIDEVSPRKATSLGEGHFATFTHHYRAGDEPVGSVSLTVLLWDPTTSKPATSRPQPGFGAPQPVPPGVVDGVLLDVGAPVGESKGTSSVDARVLFDDGVESAITLTGLPSPDHAAAGARITRSWTPVGAEQPLAHLARAARNDSCPDVRAGSAGPVWTIPLTQATIACLAIATLDFNDVHLDRDLARARGASDVYLNILGSNGLVNCYLTDWLKPEIELRSFATQLRTPAHPGDFLSVWGTVRSVTPHADRLDVVVDVIGRRARADHVLVTCHLEAPLPREARDD